MPTVYGTGSTVFNDRENAQDDLTDIDLYKVCIDSRMNVVGGDVNSDDDVEDHYDNNVCIIVKNYAYHDDIYWFISITSYD